MLGVFLAGLALRRSSSADDIELWEIDPRTGDWRRRGRLDIGVEPPIHFEFRPLTIDPETGRLVINRLSVSSRLVVFDGLELDRW